jgi:uncharacterized membrane protein
MTEWHCYVGGRQYGPITEAELRSWIEQGRLGPADLVWNESMTDWVRAADVPGLSGPEAVPSPGAPSTGEPHPGAGFQAQWHGEPYVVRPTSGGMRGHIASTDILRAAWESLRGQWLIPIAVCLLLTVIQWAAGSLPYVGILAQLAIAGPFYLGTSIFFLSLVRGQAEFAMMFAGFRRFWNALGTYLLMQLIILCYSLPPLVIGAGVGALVGHLAGASWEDMPPAAAGAVIGLIITSLPSSVLSIYANLCYSQTFYILAESPDMGAWDALRHSKMMMDGHKWRLSFLYLWFFLIGLLGLLTCCIGFLWILPLIYTSLAMFYDDLRAGYQTQQV